MNEKYKKFKIKEILNEIVLTIMLKLKVFVIESLNIEIFFCGYL